MPSTQRKRPFHGAPAAVVSLYKFTSSSQPPRPRGEADIDDRSREKSMSRQDPRPEVNRRKFLAGVAVAGAATAVAPVANGATPATAPAAASARRPSALPPNMHVAAAETGTPPKELSRIKGVPGSDFMVDVIKTLDIKYAPSNCASSFRAIHESMINYGGNKMPEYLTCTHEESGVGM